MASRQIVMLISGGSARLALLAGSDAVYVALVAPGPDAHRISRTTERCLVNTNGCTASRYDGGWWSPERLRCVLESGHADGHVF